MRVIKPMLALMTLSVLSLNFCLADATAASTTPVRYNSQVTATSPSAVTLPYTPTIEAKAVVFKDKKLEAALRTILKKKTGDIMTTDLEKLTTLNLSKKGLTDIDPLRNCKNLTSLDLSNNPLKTVAPVVLCSKLKKLDLRGTQVHPKEWLSLKSFLTGLTITSDPIEKIAKYTATTTIYAYTLNSTKDTLNLWAGENNKVPDSTLVEPGGMRYFWVTIKGYYMTEADKKANQPVYMAGKIRVNMGKDGKVIYSKQIDIAQPYATTLYFTWNGTGFTVR